MTYNKLYPYLLLIFIIFSSSQVFAQSNTLEAQSETTSSYIGEDRHILFINDVSGGGNRLIKRIDLLQYGEYPESLSIENDVITVKLIKGKKSNTNCTLYFDLEGNLKLKVDENTDS